VAVTVGSSGVVFAHSEQPLRDPRGRVHTFCHAVPGAWHVMGVTQGAGLSLRWLRDTFFPAADYDTLTAMALEVPSGSEGLLFLPYLMGERTPHLDANARGVFCGLTAAHKDRHMVRAVLEGVAFSLRDSLDVLLHMGVPTDEIRMAGGGARSDLWCQIHADVLGRDVLTLSAAEGPAYGAALLAGVGLGAWPSVQQACEQTVSIAARTTPDEIDVERYRKQHGLYADLYRRLRDFFPALS
jgi:xylulokinase